jgi:hypothetical protein
MVKHGLVCRKIGFNLVSQAFDAYGDRTSMQNSLGGVTSYVCDANGDMTSE